MQQLRVLLNNSIKHTSKGKINVFIERSKEGSRARDQFVIIRVRDTGIGINPQIMNKLFSKFGTKSETGTGLGLFISKSIIEAHGGSIWAENNLDGRGATFTFTIPVKVSQ
jgi:signal transduction histidine kinase